MASVVHSRRVYLLCKLQVPQRTSFFACLLSIQRSFYTITMSITSRQWIVQLFWGTRSRDLREKPSRDVHFAHSSVKNQAR